MFTRYFKTLLFCAAGALLTACDFEEKILILMKVRLLSPVLC